MPQTKGADYIYFNLFQPFLNNYLEPIEKWIKELNIQKLLNNNNLKEENKSIFDYLFKDDLNKSDTNVSLLTSLSKVIQNLPQYEKSKNLNFSEIESKNSNGFDVVDKSDFDSIEAEQVKVESWFSTWWYSKDLKEKQQ